MEHHPPRLAGRFLEWFCPSALYEGIEGDLLEKFENDVEQYGLKIAKRKFTMNVLRFFRPEIIARNRFNYQIVNMNMFNNYIKVASRNMAKRKMYSFINAFGLSIAIAFCTLIYLFVQDEKGFDQFHVNKDRIYRLHTSNFNSDRFEKGEEYPYTSNPYMPAKLGEVMLDEVPEVQFMTRFNNYNQGVMRYADKNFTQKYTTVDSGFFNMFSFKILSGDARKPLRTPSDAVLTPTLAKKFFGDEDAVGKTFTMESDGKRIPLTVTAIIEAPPANSSLTFEMLVMMDVMPWWAQNRENWGNASFPTFIQLHSGSSSGQLQTHLDTLLSKHLGIYVQRWRDWLKPPQELAPRKFGYQNLAEIHLAKEIYWERTSDPKYSWILGGISLLILVLACINYISLALTTSASRRIEVGIRKVIGAQKKQIAGQFTFESLLLALASMVIGLMLVVVFLPYFNDFTGKGIDLTYANFIPVAGVALLIAVIVGLLAGSYPALFLAGFFTGSCIERRIYIQASGRIH